MAIKNISELLESLKSIQVSPPYPNESRHEPSIYIRTQGPRGERISRIYRNSSYIHLK